MKQKVEIEIDIPDGWEFVRYGVPEVGEKYVFEGNIHTDNPARKLISKVFIIRKVKQWRDPLLPADFGKQARFTDNNHSWLESTLRGFDEKNWISRSGQAWKICQVCDEESKQ